ncbi:AAA family ATPase [Gaoshiqia sediminis]|uniref:ATP-binding protein n=1 Tax=Gaoshiqia sediminis TaxID=2986998 RepID=A0AA42C5C4_9BACT|nr:ATP-binding protein [Gaoshiqia sediminis]MCW0482673.1 ATP-binding protein [Gaoshiqia sediminis]
MEAPFVFGKLAIEQNFTNREPEQERLVNNFSASVNTILISPRRWGKSSLVQHAANKALKKHKDLHFCFLDTFSVRTEEEFYQLLATEVLRASASKVEVVLENAGKFLGRFLPKISFSPDNQQSLSLSLDWKEVVRHPDDILNMAEKIAVEKGWKFVFCIDEFQNIAMFNDPLAFQKKLRSSWQKQQHVAYCLYGSKRHMLLEVFTNSSMPFYKFGDLIFLEKIKKKNWISFITGRFKDTNKLISKDNAALIADLADCHPYYVQQLAQQSWLRTENECTEANVREAHQGIVDQLSLLFQSKTDELTNSQINFLHALLQGVEKFSSKETLQNYQLGTSANIVRIKRTLENKEIIDIQGANISILDPMFRFWLEKEYFKIN